MWGNFCNCCYCSFCQVRKQHPNVKLAVEGMVFWSTVCRFIPGVKPSLLLFSWLQEEISCLLKRTVLLLLKRTVDDLQIITKFKNSPPDHWRTVLNQPDWRSSPPSTNQETLPLRSPVAHRHKYPKINNMLKKILCVFHPWKSAMIEKTQWLHTVKYTDWTSSPQAKSCC